MNTAGGPNGRALVRLDPRQRAEAAQWRAEPRMTTDHVGRAQQGPVGDRVAHTQRAEQAAVTKSSHDCPLSRSITHPATR
jgi:hypothetical protein